MAALNATHPTLLDLAKLSDPDGGIADVIEIMMEEHAFLDDLVVQEGNLITGHTTTIRTGIPEPTYTKFNQGVQPTKSTTAQVTFNTAHAHNFSRIDARLADLASNRAKWRLSQDKAIIQGFANKLSRTAFYGNDSIEPTEFTGLSYYYNDGSAESGDNIVNGGGASTDNGSIWLVVFGEGKISGIVPKGSVAGLQMVDHGKKVFETDPNGNAGLWSAYMTEYQQDIGLAVEDWRFAVRIANIDKSNLTWDAATGANLPNLMFEAMERVPNLNGRAAFYMSRTMRKFVRTQLPAAVKNSTLTIENVGGKMVQNFQGIPMRRVDALAADEALVPNL